jgi:hypothetical protein
MEVASLNVGCLLANLAVSCKGISQSGHSPIEKALWSILYAAEELLKLAIYRKD